MTKRLIELINKYPYIVAWGKMMGSYGEYIERQLEKADKDNAPTDATYYSDVYKAWQTYPFHREALRLELDDYKDGRRGGVVLGWTEIEKGE